MYLINNGPQAVAVNPAAEMRNFFNVFLAPSGKVLLMISLLVTIVAAVAILVSIYNSVAARIREVAILRALGATRQRILAMVCLEAGLIGLLGGIGGLVAGHLLGGPDRSTRNGSSVKASTGSASGGKSGCTWQS
jgi:putative ABC transport system permease protein